MKKSIICAVIVLILNSCQKKEFLPNQNIQSKKYLVSFSMSDFSQTISSINGSATIKAQSVSSDSLRNILSTIGCLIVNRTTGDKQYLSQLSSDSNINFGEISDSLGYGSYTAYFAAAGIGADINEKEYSNISIPGIFSYLPNFTFAVQSSLDDFTISNSDAFVGDSINFEIDGTTNNNNLSVNMHRIVGLLQINIQDADPSLNFSVGIKTGLISGTYNYSNSIYDTLRSGSGPPYYLGGTFQKISTNVYQLYVPYVNNYFSININQLSSNDSIIKTKTINNVICQLNSITTLKGNFFSDTSNSNLGSSFSININPTWSTDTTKINF